MTRRISLLALVLAAVSVTACTNPTAPQPKQVQPTQPSLGVYVGTGI